MNIFGRRLLGPLLAVATSLVLGLPTAPAAAVLGDLPDVTWMTNGQVRATLVHDGYLYIGGKFTSVRQEPPGIPGGGSFHATNLARIDLTTGAGDPTWTPSVTTDVSGPAVHALAAIGDQIWVGGAFIAVNGLPRQNLAAVSATTGAVDPNVAPIIGATTSDRVDALAAGPSMIYAGGFFTQVNGANRKHLAAFHPDGTLDTTWRPKADKRVFSITFDCTGSSLFVGGQFRRASGSGVPYEPRETVARFDPTSGALDPWAVPVDTIGVGQKAYDMVPDCDRLYTAYGGNNYAVAFSLMDGPVGTQLWRAGTNGNVQAVELVGGQLVIGGHFQVVRGASRLRIAALDLATGALEETWDPGVEGQVGGPWDMQREADHLWVGGQFTTVGSQAHHFVVRFTF